MRRKNTECEKLVHRDNQLSPADGVYCGCEIDFQTSILPTSDGRYEAILLVREKVVARSVFGSDTEARVYSLRMAQLYFRDSHS